MQLMMSGLPQSSITMRTPEFSFAPQTTTVFAQAQPVTNTLSVDYDKAWGIFQKDNSWNSLDDRTFYQDEGLERDILDSLDETIVREIASYLKFYPSIVWLNSMGLAKQ